MKKIKPLIGKRLRDSLDAVVRDILHLMYPNPTCFVCGRVTLWFHPTNNPYGMQVGHYISRGVYPLRWDFKNIEPQCSSCNRIHVTNTLPFTHRLITVYGVERFNYLNDKYVSYHQGKLTMSTINKRLLLEELIKQRDALYKSALSVI